ncbi:Endonuclease/exonuclease/phosphatase [Chytriomyces sp. MP71]|nr:Endonuclease/exonuclease/phosphatase [Chytriomyces sp. MP71]
MELSTWNVNGILALRKEKGVANASLLRGCVPRATLHDEVPSVLCLQEVKCARDRILKEELHHVDGYTAFHATSKAKSGYSGVSVFTSRLPITTPLYAQEGFLAGVQASIASQLMQNLNASCPPDLKLAIQSLLFPSVALFENDDRNGQRDEDDDPTFRSFELQELREMDEEGRLLILDFGLFILINGYFPRACPDETVRYAFKRRFQTAITRLLHSLTHNSARNVILLGDLNVCHRPIDHCDPSNNVKENKLDAFGETHARIWMDRLLAGPEPLLVDLFRVFYPDRAGAFTCWNTLIDARRANFGTRLDYILVSPALVPWFTACDVRQEVMGSDHCPVVASMAAVHPQTGVRLADVMGAALGPETSVPVGCAELWEEVVGRGKQTSLKGWVLSGVVGSNDLAARDTVVASARGLKRKADDDGAVKLVKTLSAVTREASQFAKDAVKEQTSKRLPSGGGATTSKQKSIASFFKKVPAADTSTSTATDIVTVANTNIPANPFSTSGTSSASTTISFPASAQEKDKSINAWKTLLQKPSNPKCYHNEECKEFRVNKTGPNQGRIFYLCARPVGPSDAKPLLGEDGMDVPSGSVGKHNRSLTEFRCNYFQWKKQGGGK